jgi:hypothetical protein
MLIGGYSVNKKISILIILFGWMVIFAAKV